MSDGSTYKKRRGATRRLTQSTWWLVASFPYRIGTAGANACFPLLPVAMDGAGYGVALLWGGLSQ